MVREELRSILKEEEVDEREVVRMYRQAFNKAEETGNPSAMRAVAKDLSEMLDMRGKNGAGDSQWDPFAGGYTPPLLDEPYYPPQLGSYDEEDADYEDEDD